MANSYDVIMSVDENNGIGYDNSIPWRFPSDMARFREKTKNKIIIMGRKTWDSLPIKPLPNRFNIVISSNWLDMSEMKKLLYTKKSSPGYHGEPISWDWVDFVPSGKTAWDLALEIQDHPRFLNFGIIVIGGNSTLEWFMQEKLQELNNYYLTRVCKEFYCNSFLNTKYLENLVKTEEITMHETNKVYPNNVIKFKFELYNQVNGTEV